MTRRTILLTGSLIACTVLGCASEAPPPSGFLSDYTQLKEQSGAMRYVSPKIKPYAAFMIDPVQIRESKKPVLKPNEAAELARYFNETLAKELTKNGYKVVGQPDVGVARIRVAITGIQESTWYLNLHPATKVTGAGTGGGSMEGEIIDSITGEQLGAVIQAGKGNQFELDTFSKLDDVKDAINGWVDAAVKRLNELRKTA